MLNKQLIAEKISQYITLSLRKNTKEKENNDEIISVDDAINEYEFLKNYHDIKLKLNSRLEQYQLYHNLCNKCASKMVFKEDELKELEQLLEKSIKVFINQKNLPYFDIISFATDYLGKIKESYEKESNIFTKEEYEKAKKYKTVIEMSKMPLYYDTYSCIILLNKGEQQLQIFNYDNELICSINEFGELETDDINKTKQENSKEAIECAVNWWSKALTSPVFAIRNDENISFLGKVAALYYQINDNNPNNIKMNRFKERLGAKLKKSLEEEGQVIIKQDSKNKGIIEETLEETDLKNLIYDINTTMTITPDKVELSFGNNEAKNVLYEKPKEKVLKK